MEQAATEAVAAELVKHAVLAAMDKPDKERAAVAGWLSSLCVRGALQASYPPAPPSRLALLPYFLSSCSHT